MDKDKEIARLTDIAIKQAERNDDLYSALHQVCVAFKHDVDKLTFAQRSAIDNAVWTIEVLEDV